MHFVYNQPMIKLFLNFDGKNYILSLFHNNKSWLAKHTRLSPKKFGSHSVLGCPPVIEKGNHGNQIYNSDVKNTEINLIKDVF